jgi:hypothetical protein
LTAPENLAGILQLYIPSSVVLGRFVRQCLSIPPREHRLPRRTEAIVLDGQGPKLAPHSR